MFPWPLRSTATLRLAFFTIAGLSCESCSSLRILERNPAFPPATILRAEQHGVILEARPINGTTLNYDIFDDDLPRAGIAPVWVKLHNATTQRLDLARIRWDLRVGYHASRELNASAVLKRFYEGRKIRMYSEETHREALKDLEQIRFSPRRLNSSEQIEGFVFFKIDPQLSGIWMQRSSLVVRGIQNSDGSEIRLELLIHNANP